MSSSSCTGNVNSSNKDKLKEISFNDGSYEAVKKNTRSRNIKIKKFENRKPERTNVNSLKLPVLDSFNYCLTADSAVYCENSLENYNRSNHILKTQV